MQNRAGSYQKKIAQVKNKVSKLGIDALLLNDQQNIRYLAGFYTSGTLALVTKKGRMFYFTDSMNRSLAEKHVKNRMVSIVTVQKSFLDTLASYVREYNIRKVGFNESKLPTLYYSKLKKKMKNVRFVSRFSEGYISSIMEDIRKIKTEEEIGIIRKAARETVSIWRMLKKELVTGMTEKDIACILDVLIRGRGYENSFPTIAAIAENTAYPHAIAGTRKLKEGEHVLVDFGIRSNGYCSDLTRTWYNGRIDRQIRDFKKYVKDAQRNAIKKIKPGVKIAQVVKGSYGVFYENGLGDHILHGLGHGLGLDIHEEPSLSFTSTGSLRKGMVVTVEPGLYKEGLGGIREEDMVLVTSRGCEVLTK